MTKAIILGAAGRMGCALVRCAERIDALSVHAALDLESSPQMGEDAGIVAGSGPLGIPISCDLVAALDGADVTIDFTFHSAVPVSVEAAAAKGVAAVIGTTGLSDEETARVRRASEKVPVLWAPNMSLGVNLLFAMTERAASILDDSYDIEIVETHHRHKQDAPSGTALRLAEKAAAGRGVELDTVSNYGRKGLTGERPAGQIAVHSVRSGDVVGDHIVSFGTEGERVELTHRASSRDTFAMGALHAAQWVVGREPGLYDMQDVLGL